MTKPTKIFAGRLTNEQILMIANIIIPIFCFVHLLLTHSLAVSGFALPVELNSYRVLSAEDRAVAAVLATSGSLLT